MGAPTGPITIEADPKVHELEPPTKADTTAHDDRVRKWLALLVFTSYMGFLVFVTIRPAQLPGDTLGMIIGTLNTLSGLVIGYYFNSSSGSTAKQVAIEKTSANLALKKE